MKKKILFITMFSPFPENYGGKIGTGERIKELSENFDVNLCFLMNKNDVFDRNTGDKYCYKSKGFIREKNYSKCLFYFYKPFGMISRINKDMNIYIKETLNKEKIDIIILDTIYMQYSLNGLDLSKYKIFLCKDNIEFKLYKSIASQGNIFHRMIYSFESKKIKPIEMNWFKSSLVNGFIFINNNELDYICQEHDLRSKSIVIPPHYNTNIDKLNIDNLNIDILLVGNYAFAPNENGIMWFIEKCIPIIIKNKPGIFIYIVGKSPTSKMFKAVSKFKNVVITGEVDSVGPYYNAAKVIGVPIFQGAGVKMKLLEAVAYKKPIVTTKGGIRNSFFENTCMKVTDDPFLFSDYCIELLEHIENTMDDVNELYKILIDNNDFDKQAKLYFNFININ